MEENQILFESLCCANGIHSKYAVIPEEQGAPQSIPYSLGSTIVTPKATLPSATITLGLGTQTQKGKMAVFRHPVFDRGMYETVPSVSPKVSPQVSPGRQSETSFELPSPIFMPKETKTKYRLFF